MWSILTLLCVALPVLAFAQARGPQIKRINPPALSRPTGYTHVVEVSGETKTIYVAGQVASDKNGNVIGLGDMKAQAEQVFSNLEAALAASGAKFSDVVKMTTFVTDMAKTPAMREVRTRYLGETTPASTLVQVVSLARPEFMLEIEVVAAVPAKP